MLDAVGAFGWCNSCGHAELTEPNRSGNDPASAKIQQLQLHMPCNARLVTVTPEPAVCISALGTLPIECSCRRIVSSLVCMRSHGQY